MAAAGRFLSWRPDLAFDGVRLGTLSAAAVAWLWLLGDAVAGVPALCLSGEGMERLRAAMRSASASGLIVDEVRNWTLMAVAMMAPLLAPPLRHVVGRSYRWRRGRAVAGFLGGYGAVWGLAGIASAALITGLAVTGDAGTPMVGATALLLAAAWQYCPLRLAALRRCHRTMALAPRGWAADRHCLRYGIQHGSACLASCLPVMLATMLAFPGVPAAMLLGLWLYIERGFRRDDRLVPAVLMVASGLAVAAPVLL
ncbi:hypothetical protein BH10PSE6_BH10PSE6_05020 [soil metagenome]